MLRRALVSSLRRASAAASRAAPAPSPAALPAALRLPAAARAPASLLPRAAACAGARGFTASVPRAANALADALSAELKHELEHYETPELVKQGPPEPFDLSEEPGGRTLTLTRDFEDEEITITLAVDQGDADDEEWDEEEGEEGEETEDAEDPDEEVTVFFDVAVSKPNQQTLNFECATDGINVDVLHVALQDESDDAPQDGAYAGPVYSELDERVQDAFGAYLEQRGVDSALAEYLVELSIDKEQREYVNWLKRTAAFVAAK